LENDWEEGYISQKSFLKVNEIIEPEARRCLEMKKPVIFDGNFYWKSQIDNLIKRLPFPNVVITLKAPLDICIKRDMNRDKTHGEDAATAVYNKSTEFSHGIEIDATQSIETIIKEIVSKLPKS
jgi:tRNA uridine 5-carbamoylmethylation protein Kti12